MDFLSDSSFNMGQKEDTVDLTGNTSQPFQLVEHRKRENKTQQPHTSKGFKMGDSSCSHR